LGFFEGGGVWLEYLFDLFIGDSFGCFVSLVFAEYEFFIAIEVVGEFRHKYNKYKQMYGRYGLYESFHLLILIC
jgi:hypothetical protein